VAKDQEQPENSINKSIAHGYLVMHDVSPGTYLRNHEMLTLVVCLLLGLLVTGCTTLQPMANNAETLHEGLRGGEMIKPGDRVSVVTRDGLTRLLIVTELDEYVLKGHPEGAEMEGVVIAIPIDDIVYMDGEKFSVGKTTARTLGGGFVLFIAIIVALIAAGGFVTL
jgi:hypothetical protein